MLRPGVRPSLNRRNSIETAERIELVFDVEATRVFVTLRYKRIRVPGTCKRRLATSQRTLDFYSNLLLLHVPPPLKLRPYGSIEMCIIIIIIIIIYAPVLSSPGLSNYK